MANPASVGVDDDYPAVVLADSAAESSITLDPNKQYMIFHDGEDGTGTAETGTIVFKCDTAAVDTDASEGANKAKLMAERWFYLGPGIATLYFDIAANDCTFTIIPVRNTFGRG